ncbi:MAG: ATP-dependent RNA helicase HrpA [Bowdeniella nasicola]|nr:ATP-dependent RNA helicase HrpA [Bowdeniella nasicola]
MSETPRHRPSRRARSAHSRGGDHPRRRGGDRPDATGSGRKSRRGKRTSARAKRRAFRPFTTEQLEARRAAVPRITYPAELPVTARRDDLLAAIRDHQVVIVAGATGSGKTTQIPKICLELGRGITGMIGHTQPRRIAARTVAERIASELGQKLGDTIGYQVRFTEEVSSGTLVKLMTDGILLAEIQSDPDLKRYDTIIIDEAHERSLNIDFLLGYLTRLLPRRPDLKLIITSATIDSERFARHFAQIRPALPARRTRPETTSSTPSDEGADDETVPAPIIEVSGRTYPVEIRYRPLVREPDEEGEHEESIDQVTGICEAVTELLGEGPGDILVFLAGEADIRDADAALADLLGPRYIRAGRAKDRGRHPQGVEVVPLYARLSAAEQHRIFEPHPTRRIVLATNVAETSLTVPGIRYVVDPGNARISRFSTRTKVQRLPIEPISQASANQRSGRCGRVADGIAIRLYSQEDFASRPEYTEPEILRTSLAAVILQMASLGLGRVADFPFVDPPDAKAVRDGVQQLTEIGALADGTPGSPARLTPIGRQLARLPIDPRLGRMVLEAKRLGCASEIIVIVAALSCQDVRERPAEKRDAADAAHLRFTDPTSDFLAYLNLWRYLRTQQQLLGSSAFRRLCRAEFLNYLRLREWQDVVRQLSQLARPLGLRLHPLALPSSRDIIEAGGDVAKASAATTAAHHTANVDTIHQSLLVGLLSNLGSWDERRRDYQGARGTRFVVWPGSGLARKKHDWVMAAELVQTSRLFARTVAAIDPAWVEEAGAHLITRQYSEPFWSAKRGVAMIHEKVMLYGLTLVADRLVPLTRAGGETSRIVAREMFIDNALVGGDWRTFHAFDKHNREALREARAFAERTRRQDLLADEAARAAFFADRIPPDITSARHFDAWWKRERRERPHLLDYPRELLLPDLDDVEEADFPETWTQGDITVPLSYEFRPGTRTDGITVTVPAAVLGRLHPAAFTWVVPGLWEELCVAAIRALPKHLRKHLVPAPATAHTIHSLLPDWEEMARGVDDDGAPTPSFFATFARLAEQVSGIEVPVEAFDPDRLPPHLRVLFRVVGPHGGVLAEGTDLAALQRELAPASRQAVASAVRAAFAQPEEQERTRTPTRARQPSPSGPQATPTAPAAPTLREELGLTDWPVDHPQLPSRVETTTQGMTVRGYPALVAAGPVPGHPYSANLRILTDAGEQAARHAAGVVRLVAARTLLPTARITSRWSGTQALTLGASPHRSTDALVADAHLAAVKHLVETAPPAVDGSPMNVTDFEALVSVVRDAVEDEVYATLGVVVDILEAHRALEATVKEHSSMALLHTITDVREQAADLIYPGFIAATGRDRLPDIVRYLRGAAARLTRAAENPAADQAAAWQVTEMQDEYDEAVRASEALPINRAREEGLTEVRWMLEELRVSLFAQQLGTRGKVSPQRIRRRLAHLEDS